MTTDAAREAAKAEMYRHHADAPCVTKCLGLAFDEGAEWRATHPLPVSDEDYKRRLLSDAVVLAVAKEFYPAFRFEQSSRQDDLLRDARTLLETATNALEAVAKRRVGS